MATIIDAFLVTLGLDSTKFEQGAEHAKDDLTKLSREAEKTAREMAEKGKEAAQFYGELITKAGELFAVIAGGHELKEFIHSQQEAEIASLRLSKAIGMDIEELQAWQGAVVISGGSAEGFNASIKRMSGFLVDIKMNLPRARREMALFTAAGIKGLELGKKADLLGTLDQLAVKMKNMSAMDAMRLGSRIGLDDNLIRLLHEKGKDGIAELHEEVRKLGVYTKEDAEASEKLEEEQRKLGISMATTGRQIMTLLMPAITWVTEKFLEFSKWAAQHGPLVKSVFVGITAVVAALGAQAAIATVSMIGLTWPILLIAGVVAAVVAGITWLVLKWKEWIAGGQEAQSFVGKFFTFVMGVWNSIKDHIMTVLTSLWDMVKDWYQVIADIFGFIWALFMGDDDKIIAAWAKLKSSMEELWVDIRNIIVYEMLEAIDIIKDNFSEMFENVAKKAATVMANKMTGGLAGKIEESSVVQKSQAWTRKTAGSVTGAASSAASGTWDVIKAAGNWKPFAATPTKGGASSTTAEMHVGIINVNAPNATDAEGIAAAIQPALGSHFSMPDMAGA